MVSSLIVLDTPNQGQEHNNQCSSETLHCDGAKVQAHSVPSGTRFEQEYLEEIFQHGASFSPNGGTLALRASQSFVYRELTERRSLPVSLSPKWRTHHIKDTLFLHLLIVMAVS